MLTGIEGAFGTRCGTQFSQEAGVRQADHDGVAIAYQTLGSGPPVILVAGFTADHTYWGELAQLLADEHQVITLDNRGVGQSADPQGPYSTTAMANDVLSVADTLGLDSFDLVGQSMGTSIALTVAGKHPERLNRLVLLNGYRQIRPVFMAVVDDALRRLQSGGSRSEFARRLMPWCLSDETFRDPDRISQMVAASADNPDAPSINALISHAAVLRDFDAGYLLGAIPAETLLVGTNQDVVALPSGSLDLAKGLSNAIVKFIDGPHDVTVEQPHKIFSLLRSFFVGH